MSANKVGGAIETQRKKEDPPYYATSISDNIESPGWIVEVEVRVDFEWRQRERKGRANHKRKEVKVAQFNAVESAIKQNALSIQSISNCEPSR